MVNVCVPITRFVCFVCDVSHDVVGRVFGVLCVFVVMLVCVFVIAVVFVVLSVVYVCCVWCIV